MTTITRRFDAEASMKPVNVPGSWKPGDMMIFCDKTPAFAFFAVGIVIGADATRCTVLWPEHCRERVSVYDIKRLNSDVIFRSESDIK